MKEKERMDKLVRLLERTHFSPEFVAGKMADHCKEMAQSMESTDVWQGYYSLEELRKRRKEYCTGYRRFLSLKSELESEVWGEMF